MRVIRSFFRRGLRLGFVIGALVFLVQVLLRRQPSAQPADRASDTGPAPRPGGPEARPVDAPGNGSTAALVTTPRAEPAPATSAPLTETAGAGAGAAVSAKTAPEPAPAPATEAAPSKAKAKKATKSAKASKAAKAAKAAKASKKKAAAPTSLPAWVDPVEAAAPTSLPAWVDPVEAAAPTSLPAWVDPVEGAAPATHPVKAKLASKIYHLPGMTAYDRTTPDRCYRDAEAAEADGFRKAQR